MAELSKIRKDGVDYDLKDTAAREALETLQKNSSGGNAVYHTDRELTYPVEGELNFFTISKSQLSDSGSGIRVGDLIVASNGTVCKVNNVGSTEVGYDPIGTITGDGDSPGADGGNVVWDCIITSEERPPLSWISDTVSFSVVSGSLKAVWDKVNRGEKPNVLYQFIREYDGDYFNTFAEASCVEHFGFGEIEGTTADTPKTLRICFESYEEKWELRSESQSDIENNVISSYDIRKLGGNDSGGNANFETDETLTLKDGVLSVNTTNNMEQDNTLPITSAGVFATVGNISAILDTI